MKRYIYIILGVIFLWGLTGCNLIVDDEDSEKYKIVDEISEYIIEQLDDIITKESQLVFEHPEYEFEINYTSENSVITNEGITFSTEEQEVTLKFEITHDGVTKEYNKDVTVAALEQIEIFDLIAKYIIDNTPKKATEDVEFIKSYLNYDFEVEYLSSEEEAINSEGKVVQSGADKSVTLYFNITMNNQTEGYDTSIMILRVSSANMQQEIDAWLEGYIVDILVKEEGKLPEVDEKFKVPIRWYANQAGVVDGQNNLSVAINEGPVTLTAEYKIGITVYTKEFEYTSKGLKPADKIEYIDNFFANLNPDVLDFRTNVIYDGELEIIQSIVPANSPRQLRPKDSQGNGVKMPGGPMWVVIHDTGNPNPGADAEMHNRYIHNQANDPNGRVASWHYTIDDTKIYQHVPDDEQAWHAGDNDLGVLKYGNRNGIGIETCINPENDYELTLRRTAKLTAQLLYKYNLGLDNVVQHWHFSQKNCPAVIRANGWWQDFKDMVARELFLIMIKENKDNPHVLNWTIDKPDIIGYNGKINTYPIEDEEVTITLQVALEDFSKTYTYKVLVPGMSVERRFDTIHRDIFGLTSKTVTGDITLPTEYADYNATVKWYSSNPDVLDANGKYTKPENQIIVTLRAAITINNKTIRREYKFAVN